MRREIKVVRGITSASSREWGEESDNPTSRDDPNEHNNPKHPNNILNKSSYRNNPNNLLLTLLTVISLIRMTEANLTRSAVVAFKSSLSLLITGDVST